MLDLVSHESIAILGSGITAKHIKIAANTHGIAIVEPSEASLVIASPGIPVEQFPKVDVPIISEIEWAYRLFQRVKNPPKLIAVTGTNGKSTVTAMISQVCDIPYAGNIGIPLISFVGLEHEFPYIVVELSSYQLETCVSFCPEIAVILSISPDHLERHKSFENYVKQKKKCTQNQTKEQYLIYNQEDKECKKIAQESKATSIGFSQEMITDAIRSVKHLPGVHNQLNILATLKVAELMDINTKSMFFDLMHFKPLRHRMEDVSSVNDIRVINDSKATNPESTIAALESLPQPICLICCGENKQLNVQGLVEAIGKFVKKLIVFGELSSMLPKMVKAYSDTVIVECCTDVSEAVLMAFRGSKSGDTILFSPSSSSLDQFKNFEERGDRFVEAVEDYVQTIMV